MPVVEAQCHCGAVRLAFARPPEAVTDCNCSICRRYGVLWAYYPLDDVKVHAAEGAEHTYRWGDRTLDFHRCGTCGCVTPGRSRSSSRSASARARSSTGGSSPSSTAATTTAH